MPGKETFLHFAFSHFRVFVIKRGIAKPRKGESAKGTRGIMLCTTNVLNLLEAHRDSRQEIAKEAERIEHSILCYRCSLRFKVFGRGHWPRWDLYGLLVFSLN
jgi:hypothetical protein